MGKEREKDGEWDDTSGWDVGKKLKEARDRSEACDL